MSQPIAAPPRPSIIVDGVRKRFTINHALSLKDTVVAWIRRRTLTSDFEALKGVDIVVDEGESVAILGLNGSGKSTLLKLISGVMAPDGGQVLTRGRVAGLIEVGAGFHPELSGRENVFLNAAILGMNGGMQSVIGMVSWAHYYGRHGLGRVQGAASMVGIAASAFGPLPLAAMRTLGDGYGLGLVVLALLPLAGVALAVTYRPPGCI